MAPVAVRHRDVLCITANREALAAIRRVQVFTLPGPTSRIEGQGVATGVHPCQHGLHLRRVVLPLEDGDIGQRNIDDPLPHEDQANVHESIDAHVHAAIDVDQVGDAAGRVVTGIVPHGHQLGDMNAAVIVDILQVESDGEPDLTTQSGLEHRQVQRRLQAQPGPEGELVLFHATGDAPIRHVEPVKDVPPVARVDGPANAVRVVAEAQVGPQAEATGEVDVDHDGPKGQRRDLLAEVERVFQVGHLVGKEDGVAAREQLHPVADIQNVVQDFEPAPVRRTAPGIDPAGQRCPARAALGDRIEEGLQPGGNIRVSALRGHVIRAETENVTQQDLAVGTQHGVHLVDDLEHALRRIEELDRNLRIPHQVRHEVDDAQQVGVVEHAVEAGDRGEQHVDDRLKGRENVLDLLRDRLEDVTDEAANVDPQVRQFHHRILGAAVQRPGPAQVEVGFQFREPGGAVNLQDQPKVDRGLDTEINVERLIDRRREQLVERQPPGGLAIDIDRQETEDPARLEPGRAGIAILVNGAQLEEEQGARRLEGRHHGVVLRRAVQEHANLDFDLRIFRCRRARALVRCQIEAVRDAEADAEVKTPGQLDGKATVHVQTEAGHVEIHGNIDAHAEGNAAQRQVKLDRIGVDINLELAGTGRTAVADVVAGIRVDVVRFRQALRFGPLLQQVAVFVEPADADVVDFDMAVRVSITDDV